MEAELPTLMQPSLNFTALMPLTTLAHLHDSHKPPIASLLGPLNGNLGVWELGSLPRIVRRPNGNMFQAICQAAVYVHYIWQYMRTV